MESCIITQLDVHMVCSLHELCYRRNDHQFFRSQKFLRPCELAFITMFKHSNYDKENKMKKKKKRDFFHWKNSSDGTWIKIMAKMQIKFSDNEIYIKKKLFTFRNDGTSEKMGISRDDLR